MANVAPPNPAPSPPTTKRPLVATTQSTARPLPTTTTTRPLPTTTTTTPLPTSTTTAKPSDSTSVGIGIGFGILFLLLLVLIIYACFLYRRLMRTAQINRRASNIFSKLSRKKVLSTNQKNTDCHDAPVPAGSPQQESIYLDMRSSGTKGAERTQKLGHVNQGGPVDNPPIYDTVNEVSFANEPPTYENFHEGKDNPIYENLEKQESNPLYINITPSATPTPTPSPSHSPGGHKSVQAMKSSEYVLMSNPGANKTK
ncbi:uncharacterized membrane protein DDB_G0293934-like [Penaeus chinensis]|uniref:uncharacterized membrane protein DDB_G0293934-like n=1 Tax=Penaeus chinensis TaxID=139456 RepID=UPI001FB6F891|nr:uncharacterized membrane protein DDB_G0293934-like [Penaeus chinensis]XP_047469733.1 uncharacterized membrane protein DDB_G0293934-like [Penaeus chinensis]